MEELLREFMDQMNRRFDALESTMNTRFEEVNNRFEEVNNRITHLETDMNRRFEEVNNGIILETDMNRRFEEVNQRFEKVDARFDIIDHRLEHIEKDIQDIKRSVAPIEENQPKDILAMLHRMDKKLDHHDNEVLALNKRVSMLETEIVRIDKQLQS